MAPVLAGFIYNLSTMTAYRYVNALSLDVVIGATVTSLFFAKLIDVRLPVTVLISLSLAVWTIYTADHLWDASQSKNPLVSFRHQFHKQYFRPLCYSVVICVVLGIGTLWFLPATTRIWGIWLTLCVMGYFLFTLIQNRRLYHKELIVAIVYTSGVLIGPYSLYQGSFNMIHSLVAIQFLILALTNLLIFALYEIESDRIQKFGSLAISIGEVRTKNLILAFLIAQVISAPLAWYFLKDWNLIANSQWIVLIMSGLLISIFRWPLLYKKHERFRYLGDAVFFVPLLAL